MSQLWGHSAGVSALVSCKLAPELALGLSPAKLGLCQTWLSTAAPLGILVV